MLMSGRKQHNSVKQLSFNLKINLKIFKIYNLDKQDVVVVLRCSVVSDSYDPTDYSQPGSSVHGILQASTVEWVATPSSRGSSQPRDRTQVSCLAGGFFTD